MVVNCLASICVVRVCGLWGGGVTVAGQPASCQNESPYFEAPSPPTLTLPLGNDPESFVTQECNASRKSVEQPRSFLDASLGEALGLCPSTVHVLTSCLTGTLGHLKCMEVPHCMERCTMRNPRLYPALCSPPCLKYDMKRRKIYATFPIHQLVAFTSTTAI